MGKEQCITRVIQALADKGLGKKDIEHITREVDDFLTESKYASETELRTQLKRFQEKKKIEYQKQQLSIQENRLKLFEGYAFITDPGFGGDIERGFKSFYQGAFHPVKGGNLSIGMLREVKKDTLFAILEKFERKDPALFRAYEKGELDVPVGIYVALRNKHRAEELRLGKTIEFVLPDNYKKTIPQAAQKIGDMAFDAHFASWKMVRESGSAVEFNGNFITQRNWEASTIQKNRRGWVADVLKHADEKMFPEGASVEAKENIINEMADSIIDGRIERGLYAEDTMQTMVASKVQGAYDKRISQSRKITFSTPEAEIEMMQKWGNGRTISDGVHSTLVARSRQAALMQKMGTNPRSFHEKMKAMALHKEGQLDVEASDTLKNKLLGVDNVFHVAIGDSTRAPEKMYAKVAMFNLTWNALTKLGVTGIKSFTDVFTTMTQRDMITGRGFIVEGALVAKNMVEGLVTGSMTKTERNAIADKLEVYVTDSLMEKVSPFVSEGGRPGKLTQNMVKGLFTVNGLRYVTDVGRTSAVKMVASFLGDHAGKSFDMLPKSTRDNVFLRYKIDAADWDLMRTHALDEIGVKKKVKAIVTDRIEMIPLETIKSAKGFDSIAEALKHRKSMSENYRVMLKEFSHIASPQPGLREQAIATFGTDINTPHGAAIRTIMQFKSYPLAMDTILRRMIQDSPEKDTFTKGIFTMTGARKASMFVASGIATTYVADSMVRILRNQKPLALWDSEKEGWDAVEFENLTKMMVGSGALGLYADLGHSGLESAKYGRSGALAKSILGPSLDTVQQPLKIAGNLATATQEYLQKGLVSNKTKKALAKSTIDLKRQLPFSNHPLFQATIDQMVFDPLSSAYAGIDDQKREKWMSKQSRIGKLPFIPGQTDENNPRLFNAASVTDMLKGNK